jgi:hypothetical protein
MKGSQAKNNTPECVDPFETDGTRHTMLFYSNGKAAFQIASFVKADVEFTKTDVSCRFNRFMIFWVIIVLSEAQRPTGISVYPKGHTVRQGPDCF